MKSDSYLPEAKITVPVEGGDLAVFRYGPEGGRPILAIHGITSTNRAWQCFARAVAPHGYTLYAVDLRGRGDSNSLPGPFGMAVHARDMLTAIDSLGLAKVDVIGASMGGWVAISLLGLAPERISRTVLCDGGIILPLPPQFSVDEVIPIVLGPALARLGMPFASFEAYRNFWKTQPAFIKGWSSSLDEYVDYDLRGTPPLMYASTNKKAVLEDAIDEFGNEFIEHTLRNLTDEVLMLRSVRGLQNEETPLYPEAMLKEVLINYPKIKLVTMPDTNHYDMLLDQENANACAKLIYGVSTGSV
ncbi:MAG: alpha/beta hydrolase [Actinobacteria bacterium]|nr:alpha/beta hydrolase [Actinomycetota bacterium]